MSSRCVSSLYCMVNRPKEKENKIEVLKSNLAL
jgi:hypothetical protein